MIPKYRQQDELEFIKYKNFYVLTDTNKKVEKQPTEQEKIFANYVSDKELIFRIHKELLQFSNNKTNNLPLKLVKGDPQKLATAKGQLQMVS